jgi:hypothetical protein
MHKNACCFAILARAWMIVRAARRLMFTLFVVTIFGGAGVAALAAPTGHHCAGMSAGDCVFPHASEGIASPNDCSPNLCGAVALPPMFAGAIAVYADSLKMSAFPVSPEIFGRSVSPGLRPPIL